MVANTRDRMIAGAADLISRRGVVATSLRDVVSHTKTPRGSISHHFPGGKQQLLEEAVQYADDAVSQPLSALLEERGPVEGFRAFISWWLRILEASDFEAGCPVLAAAIEPISGGGLHEIENAQAQERLRTLVDAAFVRWRAILASAFTSRGVPSTRAEGLAALAVASVEGTVAMCRAARSSEPLHQVCEQLLDLIKGALPPEKLQ